MLAFDSHAAQVALSFFTPFAREGVVSRQAKFLELCAQLHCDVASLFDAQPAERVAKERLQTQRTRADNEVSK